MITRATLAMAVAALGLSAATAAAQDTEQTIAEKQAANAELKIEARKLGVSVGNAYACAEDADKQDMADNIQVMYDLMIKGAGSDIAFQFAAASGFGAAQPKDQMPCDEMLSAFAETLADFGLDDDIDEEEGAN